MKSIQRALLFILFLPCLAQAQSWHDFNKSYINQWQFKPEAGVELSQRYLNWEHGFGHNHFASKLYQVTPYVQVQFHKYFALKFGYDISNTTRFDQVYFPGNSVLGHDPDQEVELAITTKVKLKSFHGDLFFKIAPEFFEQTPIAPAVFLGLSRIKFYLSQQEHDTNTEDQSLPLTTPTQFNFPWKTGFRYGFNLEYHLSECFNCYFVVLQERFSRAESNTQILEQTPLLDQTLKIKIKKSTQFSIGMNYKFNIF